MKGALGQMAAREATISELDQILKGMRSLMARAESLRARLVDDGQAAPFIDPTWFQGNGNRHLSEEGRAHLRALLQADPNRNKAAKAMGIDPSAVVRWARKWGL